jgi:hypothetical protein
MSETLVSVEPGPTRSPLTRAIGPRTRTTTDVYRRGAVSPPAGDSRTADLGRRLTEGTPARMMRKVLRQRAREYCTESHPGIIGASPYAAIRRTRKVDDEDSGHVFRCKCTSSRVTR